MCYQLSLDSQVTLAVVGVVLGMNLRMYTEKYSAMTRHYNCMQLDDLASGNAGNCTLYVTYLAYRVT